MTFKDIVTLKQYEKDGTTVKKWLKCGTLRINNDNKMYIEMNDRPDITYFVFDQKDKDEQTKDTPKDW